MRTSVFPNSLAGPDWNRAAGGGVWCRQTATRSRASCAWCLWLLARVAGLGSGATARRSLAKRSTAAAAEHRPRARVAGLAPRDRLTAQGLSARPASLCSACILRAHATPAVRLLESKD